MPTGYTVNIAKDITFEQFIMDCARAFDALVTMCDEPSDAKIPERFELPDYHKEKIEQVEKELAETKAMSIETANEKAKVEYEREITCTKKRLREKTDLREKYQAMLFKAKAWQPPSPDHERLQEFMIEQIKNSIKFDCDTKYDIERADKLTCLLLSEWKEKQIAKLTKSLEYYKKENAEEIERTEGRNLWLKQLRESISYARP